MLLLMHWLAGCLQEAKVSAATNRIREVLSRKRPRSRGEASGPEDSRPIACSPVAQLCSMTSAACCVRQQIRHSFGGAC